MSLPPEGLCFFTYKKGGWTRLIPLDFLKPHVIILLRTPTLQRCHKGNVNLASFAFYF